jgi:hypothetical protein
MSHGRTLPTFLAALLLAVLTCSLAHAQQAGAATMSAALTTADPAMGTPVAFTLTGDAPGPAHDVYMYEKLGDSPCAATYDGNTGGGTSYFLSGSAYGSYSLGRNFTPDTAGTWTVCFYLATSTSAAPDAMARSTFTARPPHITMSIAMEPDPRADKVDKFTVSGNSEIGRQLFITTINGSGDCPTSAGGRYTYSYYAGPGAFSYPSSILPGAGHYKICAWLAADRDSPTDGSTSLDVDIREVRTSINIDMDRTPFLLGAGRRTATVTVTSEDSSVTWDAQASGGNGQCWPSEYGSDDTIGSSGSDRKTVDVDPGPFRVVSLCVYLYRQDRTVLASASATVSELPIATPVAAANTPRGVITDRRPTFAWSAGAGVRDDLVLSDRDGGTLLLVGSDGAWVPSGGDSQGGQQLKAPASARRGYDRLAGATTYTTAGGTTTVDVKRLLPPGAYRWSVNRTRSDGESARMAPVAFKIAGPDVTRLKVGSRSFPVANSRHPGRSELKISTTPWAYVRLALSRGGRTQVQNLRWDGTATHTLSFAWTCKTTGGAYTYNITASDDDGHSFTRRGRIKTISHARCASLRAAERRKVDRRVAQRRKREAQAQARRDAAERARVQKQIDQCHSIGGTVKSWDWGDGTYTLFCVTPYGALIM